MGRGDKKTKKGKISMGSFGVHRPHKTKVTSVIKAKPKATQKAKPKAKSKAIAKEEK